MSSMSQILRVFPRQTNATPDDALALVNETPGLWVPECDEVHVSCAFTYDIPQAERLAKAWEVIGVPVKIGGPAFNAPGGKFVPGRYLKQGYVITSRGCPNNCWFCQVPKREGGIIRELPIVDGWNLLDDNLLACSRPHIEAVFDMLGRQKQRPEFTGGIEAKRLESWSAERIAHLKPASIFMAYDTPDDWEPLINAVQLLKAAGLKFQHQVRAYVLIGWPKDTIEAATKRLEATALLGVFPMAMLYRGKDGRQRDNWTGFQREWANPIIVGVKMKEITARR